jgi:hypothetical protein
MFKCGKKNLNKKTKGACSSPISMGLGYSFFVTTEPNASTVYNTLYRWDFSHQLINSLLCFLAVKQASLL